MHRVLLRFVFAGGLFALVAGFAPASCADDIGFAPAEGAAPCVVPCVEDPWLTFSADALFLHLNRGTRSAEPLVIAVFENETRMTTHDLSFGTEVGPRFAFDIGLDSHRSIETVYFGLHQWGSTRDVADENNLSIPSPLAVTTQDFFMADRMTLDYRSRIHNVEVNYWRRLGCTNFHLLAGFRYFNLDERFNINSEDDQTGTSDYRVNARNNLYGAQLGGRWEATRGQLGVDFFGKAGVFGNAAGQRTFMGDLDNTVVLRDFNTTGSRTAFIGELGINATWRFTECLAARAGYQLMWVEGVARAPDQLDFTNTLQSGSALVFDQGAFMHGAHVGLEARW
ncbi:MAG: BBP7 family outer membrane beta-barrel protein [Thermoguttaceae bacterium]|jgi:hypothetical protein|nr:BBP7 family outer membrane beta-barrel protein [Thermoguttaceae bacterium]